MQENRPEEGIKLHTKSRISSAPSTEVSGDIFSFRGGATGIVKILEPMSPLLNYFEYQILDRGHEASIGIGVGERGYPMSRMPGWNRNSCGYHADDGKLYHESGLGRAFGPTCTNGDRMGCGVVFDCDLGYGTVQVFFTKNGKQVGELERMRRPIHGLYPLIGLHSRGEKVHYLGHWRRMVDGAAEPMEHDESPGEIWLRSNGVKFVEDGFTLEYAGNGGDVQDVGIAQSRYPLTRTNHYFEFEILGTGSHGALAIGLAKTTYPLHRHPGWNPGAVGYHADDGKLFKERGHGDQFGPCCTEGDRMGCGIRFSVHGAEREEEGGDTESDETDSDSERGSAASPIPRYSIGSSYSTSDDSDESEESYADSYEEQIFPEDIFGHPRIPAGLRLPRMLRERHLLQQPKPKPAPSGRTCKVYFTKNGEKIGETECNVPRGGFYPVVAMLSQGEKLRVDFNPLTG